MPLNYLELEPQISQYAQSAVELSREIAAKLEIAIRLIHQCGQNHAEARELFHNHISKLWVTRRAAPFWRTNPPISRSAAIRDSSKRYTLLASDGSQISPGGHDAVSIALINTSRIRLRPGSGSAPEITHSSRFLFDEEGRMDLGQISDDLVSLRRDMAEMEILSMYRVEE
jgi:hypothetical protein